MAIPSSGPISLTTVQTEFGGSNPIGINEYYAGGSYVAAGTTGTYGAVPSSGAISLQNFYGTSAVIPNYITWMNTLPTYSLRPNDTRPSSVGGFTYWATGGTNIRATVTKINEATGAVVWSKLVSTSVGNSVNYTGNVTSVTDSSGNTYLIGKPNGGTISIVVLDSSGNTTSYSAPSSASDSTSGDCVMATLNPAGTAIYFACSSGSVTRFYSLNKSTLAFNWCYQTSISYTDCKGIVVDSADNVYFGAYDTVLKYTNAGTFVSQKRIAFAGSNRKITGMGIDSSNNIYLLSDTGYLVKYDSTLTTAAWSQRLTPLYPNTAFDCLAVNASGTCIVTTREQAYINSLYTIPRQIVTSISSSGTLNYSNSLSFIFYIFNASYADASSFYLGGYFAGTDTSTSLYADLPMFTKLPIDGTAKGAFPMGSSAMYYDGLGGMTLTSSSSTSANGSYTITTRAVSTNSTIAPVNSASGNTFASQAVAASTTKGSASFTVPGTYTWVAPTGVTSVSAVVVGGGGGGASSRGAGGGGGGLAYANNKTVTPGSSYTVTVASGGAGGPGSNTYVSGYNGGSSSLNLVGAGTITATGGQPQSNSSLGGTPSGTYTAGYNGGVGGTSTGVAGGGGGAAGYTGAGGAGGNGSANGATSTGGGGGGGGGGSAGSGSIAWNGTFGGGVGLIGLGNNGIGRVATASSGAANNIGGGGGSYGLGGYYQYANFGSGGAGGASNRILTAHAAVLIVRGMKVAVWVKPAAFALFGPAVLVRSHPLM